METGVPLCSRPGIALGYRAWGLAQSLGLGPWACAYRQPLLQSQAAAGAASHRLLIAHCGNAGHNPCSPPSQQLFLVCVSLWGEDKGGNDQKLKLANCKQLRPGIRGQLRTTVCSLWP